MELTAITLFGFPIVKAIMFAIIALVAFGIIGSVFLLIGHILTAPFRMWEKYKRKKHEDSLSEEDKRLRESIEHVARTWSK